MSATADPSDMTPKERLAEVAASFLRLRTRPECAAEAAVTRRDVQCVLAMARDLPGC